MIQQGDLVIVSRLDRPKASTIALCTMANVRHQNTLYNYYQYISSIRQEDLPLVRAIDDPDVTLVRDFGVIVLRPEDKRLADILIMSPDSLMGVEGQHTATNKDGSIRYWQPDYYQLPEYDMVADWFKNHPTFKHLPRFEV